MDEIIQKTNGNAQVLRVLIPEYEGLTAAIALGVTQLAAVPFGDLGPFQAAAE